MEILLEQLTQEKNHVFGVIFLMASGAENEDAQNAKNLETPIGIKGYGMAALALQRTKQYLEDKGFHVWIVEHWNQWARIRQDAFGLLDLISIRHDCNGVWGVNSLQDNGEMQAHINRYMNGYDHPKKGRIGPNPHLPVWLSAGNRFSLFGWGLRGAAGKRKTWTLRTVDFYLNGAEVKWREVLPEALDVI